MLVLINPREKESLFYRSAPEVAQRSFFFAIRETFFVSLLTFRARDLHVTLKKHSKARKRENS